MIFQCKYCMGVVIGIGDGNGGRGGDGDGDWNGNGNAVGDWVWDLNSIIHFRVSPS